MTIGNPPPSAIPKFSDELMWVHIDDFTPGIYSATNVATSSAFAIDSPVVAPLGAADPTATVGCMSLPGGGLGSMMSIVASYSMTDLGITGYPASAGYIVGLTNSFQVGSPFFGDELVIALEWNTGLTGGHGYVLFSALTGVPSANLLFGATLNPASEPIIGGSPYPFSTRVASTNPTTTVGNPTIVFVINCPSETGGGSPGGYMLLYPNPASPNVFGVVDIFEGVAGAESGPALGFQNRIVCLSQENYGWPIGPQNVINDESINFTDPPNSEVWPVQNEIFVAEEPNGYGAFGTVSAGELFLVKCRDGGVVVTGEINDPTVTFLPAIQPTGAMVGRADANNLGLFYCSVGQGAHIWNGGNASQKVSAQLDDNFYEVSIPIPSPYFGFFVQRWGDWMLFSNNWVLNTLTGGWWRLADGVTMPWFWYVPGVDQNIMYAAQCPVDSDTEVCIWKLSREIPGPSFTWQSLPIRPADENRTVNVREVMVRAANLYEDSAANITVTLFDNAGTSYPTAAQTLPLTPGIQQCRFVADVVSEDITVSVTSVGAVSSPVVYSIHVGFKQRTQAPPIT